MKTVLDGLLIAVILRVVGSGCITTDALTPVDPFMPYEASTNR